MITGLQLVAIVFALIMIYFAYLHYRRKEIGKIEIISWWVIWVTTIIIIIFPDLLRNFASKFFITRVFDLMVVGGFILVIFLSYRAYVKTRNLEEIIDNFIRKEGLKELKNAKKTK